MGMNWPLNGEGLQQLTPRRVDRCRPVVISYKCKEVTKSARLRRMSLVHHPGPSPPPLSTNGSQVRLAGCRWTVATPPPPPHIQLKMVEARVGRSFTGPPTSPPPLPAGGGQDMHVCMYCTQ